MKGILRLLIQLVGWGISILIAAFGIANRQHITLTFTPWLTTSVPVGLLMIGMFACGILATYFFVLSRLYRWYAKEKQLKQQIDALKNELATRTIEQQPKEHNAHTDENLWTHHL